MPPVVVVGLLTREVVARGVTVDFAAPGLVRDLAVGTRLVVVDVRLLKVVLLLVCVDWPEASGLPSSLCTDV